MNPTKEQIDAARHELADLLNERSHNPSATPTSASWKAIEVLLAATAAAPEAPRPDDIVKLTALVAAELRAHNVQAQAHKTRLYIAVLRNNRFGPWASMAVINMEEEHLGQSPRKIVEYYLAELAKPPRQT